MKNIAKAILLSHVASYAYAGDISGNGGDVVFCGEPSPLEVDHEPVAGLYALDFIASYAFEDPNTVPVESLEKSINRIRGLLSFDEKVLAGFDHYIKLLANPDIGKGNRVWDIRRQGLRDVKDEDLTFEIPNNCTADSKKFDPNGTSGVYQIIIRKVFTPDTEPAGNSWEYNVNKSLWEKIKAGDPRQYSFLVVHEWLWDHLDHSERIYKINRLLHSNVADKFAESGDLENVLRDMGFQSLETRTLPNPRFGAWPDEDGEPAPAENRVRCHFNKTTLLKTMTGYSNPETYLVSGPEKNGVVAALIAACDQCNPRLEEKSGFSWVHKCKFEACFTKDRQGVEVHLDQIPKKCQ